jgi:hypothetical protein
MTSKTTIALLAAGLALVTLAPLAGASTLDDTLSRSFVYVSGVRAETAANTGVGWYDNSNPPNVCIIDLLGVQSPLVGVFYYETGRVYHNAPGFGSAIVIPPNGVSVPLACPAIVNPLCSAATMCAIHVAPVTIQPVVRTIIPQDGSVCTQQSSFITCIATSASWTLNACPWASASFTARAPGSNKGLLGGTGLENVILSQDINCTAYTFATPVSGTSHLGSDGNPLASGFDGVVATDLVPFGNGVDNTSFVVQCLKATYTTIDSSVVPPLTGSATEDGVDYEQILDLDAVTLANFSGWTGDLAKQVGGVGGTSGNLALQGLYDLGGDNDCDFAV